MNFLRRFFFRQSSEDCSVLLHSLVTHAIKLGLRPVDVENAQEMLERGENLLCFDIIANQFDSYDIEITQEFYNILAQTGQCLKVEESSYSFNQKLIRSKSQVPEPVKAGLAKIVHGLLIAHDQP